MKKCKYCGANVEGLINRCDCCGAPLIQDKVVWQSKVTAYTGDLPQYLKKVFEQLDEEKIKKLFPCQDILIFEFFCWPDDMLEERKVKNKIFSRRREKQAVVTTIIPFDSFVGQTNSSKERLIKSVVKQRIKDLYETGVSRKYVNRCDDIDSSFMFNILPPNIP